jgi:hypothetical protein
MPPIATTLTQIPPEYTIVNKFGAISGAGTDILTALTDLIDKTQQAFPAANCIWGVSFSGIQYGDAEECVATGFACTLDPDPAKNQQEFQNPAGIPTD